MSDKKNNILNRVLVAPLDWGLGHATRCIPLIHRLLEEGNQVYLAGSGPSGHLLRTEFPRLPYTEIPSHAIRYSKNAKGFAWTLLKQIPALIRQIRKERKWLNEYLTNHSIDQVISDNRYGLYHPSTHNIILTHQLNVQTETVSWLEKFINKILSRLLTNFDAVWVPDVEGVPNLSGELGHPTNALPIPVKYIGNLSRFTPNHPAIIAEKITILLSGPEPQRTILEEKCLRELAEWKGPITLIRGLPLGGKPIDAPPHWQVFDHLPIDLLQQQIEEAEWVIARCGYSTLMDLDALNKQAILIPTPGQPEQEYLARHLSDRKEWAGIDQSKDLLSTLNIARSLPITNGNFTSG
ncbi:MAG: glycosyltransferase [Bacteroidota bacterium]